MEVWGRERLGMQWKIILWGGVCLILLWAEQVVSHMDLTHQCLLIWAVPIDMSCSLGLPTKPHIWPLSEGQAPESPGLAQWLWLAEACRAFYPEPCPSRVTLSRGPSPTSRRLLETPMESPQPLRATYSPETSAFRREPTHEHGRSSFLPELNSDSHEKPAQVY